MKLTTIFWNLMETTLYIFITLLLLFSNFTLDINMIDDI